MGVRELIQRVRDREKTLTVYAAPDTDLVPELREYFASQHVAIERATATDVEYAVLSGERGEFLTAVSLDALRALTRGSPRGIGEDVPYSPLLVHLDRTTFTSYSPRQMLAVTREIEDRAWRAGDGRLHAGFQSRATLERQQETYELLAGSAVDVHVYSQPDARSVAPDDAAFHADDDIAGTWFVVYDAVDEQQSSALLAEERGDGGFFGVWTYDPGLVADALDAIGAPQCSA